MNNTEKKAYPWVAVVLAIALVFGFSFVPWSDITGGTIKDFNLLGDVMLADSTKKADVAANIFVDPALVEAIAAMQAAEADTMPDSIEISPEAVEADRKASVAIADSLVDAPTINTQAPRVPSRVNGEMVIEDYTPDGRGLRELRRALSAGKARIAVLGDSYIEGDIFTQDIRSMLQNAYGGRGVGYVPAHSIVSGFRQSVRQNDSGWKHNKIQQAASSKYFNLAGEYFTAPGTATVTYKGNPGNRTESSWSNSSLLFIAPDSGFITMANDIESVDFPISPSTEVQKINLKGETSSLKITSHVPGLVFLGAWLEDSRGVSVDCMSIRGDAGITRKNIKQQVTGEMRRYVDYDLIILEYGINALTAEQKNYNHYAKMMQEVIRQVKLCYPNADILLLGVGDRGQKVDGAVRSLPTVDNMIAAQRKAAQQAGCLFWDTREAQGGPGAVVDWRKRKLINGDYIHLNSAGGKELAKELVKSINTGVNE